MDQKHTSDKLIYITKSGAFIKFKYLPNQDFIKKICKYFTLKYKDILNNIKSTKQYKINKKKGYLIVPRFGIQEILNKSYGLSKYKTISQFKIGNDPSNPFIWNGKQTHNQKIISDYIINNIYTDKNVSMGTAGLILDLEAGQGKSYLAAYLISVINKKTAIILHTTSLLEQWKKVLISCFPNASIGYYYGKKKVLGDIMLMIIDSTVANDNFVFKNVTLSASDYFNMFDFIIYDECHIYANNSGSKAFRIAQSRYVLGLSATPDENINGYDKIVWWGLGPVLKADTLPGYQTTNNLFTADVHRIMYYGPDTHTKLIKNDFTNKTDVMATITMLCDDKYRNDMIIENIYKCYANNLFTYVFADRREYLELLRTMFIKYLEEKNISDNITDIIRIVGGSSNAELENAETKSRVIFTTYQFSGTGRSIIKMNALIMATPRKSKMKQYIKRIFRLGSDTSIKRQIYDIVDMKVSLKNQWNERKKFYKDNNFDIIEHKVKYTDIIDQVKNDDNADNAKQLSKFDSIKLKILSKLDQSS